MPWACGIINIPSMLFDFDRGTVKHRILAEEFSGKSTNKSIMQNSSTALWRRHDGLALKPSALKIIQGEWVA